MSPEELARTGSEDNHQRAIFAWAAKAAIYGFAAANDMRTYKDKVYADEVYGEGLAVAALEGLHATPNGGKRDIRTAANLKATGTKPGYPDISLDVARGEHHGLRIELKVGNGKLSKDQKIWLDRLNQENYLAVVVTGYRNAIIAIQNYLNNF